MRNVSAAATLKQWDENNTTSRINPNKYKAVTASMLLYMLGTVHEQGIKS